MRWLHRLCYVTRLDSAELLTCSGLLDEELTSTVVVGIEHGKARADNKDVCVGVQHLESWPLAVLLQV